MSNSKTAFVILTVTALLLASVGMTLSVYSYSIDTVENSPDNIIEESN